MNILDASPYWKKAHVAEIYYHVDAYAQRTVEIFSNRVEFWKFFPRTATNSLITVLWFDRIRNAMANELFVDSGVISDSDVLNETLFIACAKLARQELERDMMPAWEPSTTLRSGITVDERTVDFSEIRTAVFL